MPLLLAACATVTIAACHDGGDEDLAQTAQALSPLPNTSVKTAAIVDQVCPGRRFVGRRTSGGSCPKASGPWVSGSLFGGIGHTGPDLDAYCVYDWSHASAPTAAEWSLLPSDGAQSWDQWLDRDCMAVAASSPTSDARQAVAPELQHSLANQLGVPTAVPAGGATVRIAVVDSRPEVYHTNTNDQLGHGLGMLWLIKNLTCDLVNGSCPFKAKPYLALDLTSATTSDPVQGGFYGYQSRLAREVARAVDDWQSAATPGRLVINLSVGWNPVFNDGTAHVTSHAVEAVRDVLEHASCQGALIFAAAGNASGTLDSSGPTYPAAWESELARCGKSERPLLRSVGAVDGTDAPVVNARPGGRPELAAPGFMVMPEHPQRVVGPFTGSSPSSAIAVAAAAHIWSRNPGLSAEGVAAKLRAAGSIALPGTQADYCLDPPCGAIRRISICESLKASLPPNSISCSTPVAGTGSNPSVTVDFGSFTVQRTSASIGSVSMTSSCPVPITRLRSSTSPQSLPNWYLCADSHLPMATAVPAVEPQPTPDPCGACMLERRNPWLDDAMLHILVADNFATSATPTSLQLYDANGVVLRNIDLTGVTAPLLSTGLAPGDSISLRLSELAAPSLRTATINWVTDIANPWTTHVSPILVR